MRKTTLIESGRWIEGQVWIGGWGGDAGVQVNRERYA